MIIFPNPTTSTSIRDYRAPQRSRDLLIAHRTRFEGASDAGDLDYLETLCR